MTTAANFVVESDTIAVFGHHHAKFRENAFTALSGPVTMPLGKTTYTGTFRPKIWVRGVYKILEVQTEIFFISY